MTHKTPDVAGYRLAATVVLLRDAADGPEVLMLERPHDRGSFAGNWVFPGGTVDPEDELPHDANAADPDSRDPEESAARRAAVREVREETALELRPDDLVPTARWTPPSSTPVRFRTWFYVAEAPAGELRLSAEEAVDAGWFTPAAALERHAAGILNLVPPTWVTLHRLIGHHSVQAVLTAARRAPLQQHHTRRVSTARGDVLLWEPDVAYLDDTLIDTAGARHRLELGTLPWVYIRSAG
ncbi:NUDIX domain-containing protein [Salinibacterium sp. ZJ454]|uniref:NUDIX hydrolase n=1 Tax=Salinibacterium sp. ZJ454 TaxID=2708339 RepID=UPI0014218FF1|nr:NUDIX domain-containing protein [Salinibacterium sp. ZJ454]